MFVIQIPTVPCTIFNPNLLGLADSEFRDARIQDEWWEQLFSLDRREDVKRSVLAGGHQEVGPVGDGADRRREQALPARTAMQSALYLQNKNLLEKWRSE